MTSAFGAQPIGISYPNAENGWVTNPRIYEFYFQSVSKTSLCCIFKNPNLARDPPSLSLSRNHATRVIVLAKSVMASKTNSLELFRIPSHWEYLHFFKRSIEINICICRT